MRSALSADRIFAPKMPPTALSRAARTDNPLKVAQRVWSKTKPARGLNIPRWYCIYYGTAPWVLTQRGSSTSEKRKALAFIVRLNWLMDYGTPTSHGAWLPPQQKPTLPCFYSRALVAYHQSFIDQIKSARQLSWAHSPFYKWGAVLACTVRRYINLCPPATLS